MSVTAVHWRPTSQTYWKIEQLRKEKIVKLKQLNSFSLQSRSIFSIHVTGGPSVTDTLWNFCPNVCFDGQGGRGWQPFGENKNGQTNFRSAHVFAIFAANLQIYVCTICKIYYLIVHFLPNNHCFCYEKNNTFCPKSPKKYVNRYKF